MHIADKNDFTRREVLSKHHVVPLVFRAYGLDRRHPMQNLAAPFMNDPRRNAHFCIGKRRHVLFQKVDESPLPLEERQELQSLWRGGRACSDLARFARLGGGRRWCDFVGIHRALGEGREGALGKDSRGE